MRRGPPGHSAADLAVVPGRGGHELLELLVVHAQALGHRPHRLALAVHHQPTHVQSALGPLIPALERAEHLHGERLQTRTDHRHRLRCRSPRRAGHGGLRKPRSGCTRPTPTWTAKSCRWGCTTCPSRPTTRGHRTSCGVPGLRQGSLCLRRQPGRRCRLPGQPHVMARRGARRVLGRQASLSAATRKRAYMPLFSRYALRFRKSPQLTHRPGKMMDHGERRSIGDTCGRCASEAEGRHPRGTVPP